MEKRALVTVRYFCAVGSRTAEDLAVNLGHFRQTKVYLRSVAFIRFSFALCYDTFTLVHYYLVFTDTESALCSARVTTQLSAAW